jgi:outer membrane protein assembly factor BamB
MSTEEEMIIVGLEASIVALHPETGGLCWHNEMTLGGHSSVALAVSPVHVFASASAKKLFCLDKKTGETLWSEQTTGMGRATLMVMEDRICVSKGGFVDCFSFAGVLLWSKNLKRWGKKAAALAYGNQVVQADG